MRIILDYGSDATFCVDIIINFFSAYFDKEDNLQHKKSVIAIHYLKGWFWIDFVSVIPFDLLFPNNKYNTLAKLFKVSRLYRLLKLTKLMRMLKVLREKNNLLKFLTELLRIGIGVERLFIAIVSVVIFCHIGACIWYMLSEMTNSPYSWVSVNQMRDKTQWE